MLTFWAICGIMSTPNQSQKQGGVKMIWEEMSYNRLSDCFSFIESLEYNSAKKIEIKKIQTKKNQNNEEAKEEEQCH